MCENQMLTVRQNSEVGLHRLHVRHLDSLSGRKSSLNVVAVGAWVKCSRHNGGGTSREKKSRKDHACLSRSTNLGVVDPGTSSLQGARVRLKLQLRVLTLRHLGIGGNKVLDT